MNIQTLGNASDPAVLFFHAMGVTGESSMPVAEHLKASCYCIMPTSSVYCPGQNYAGKADEIRQVEDFLQQKGIRRLALVVASSIGADLAMAFLTETSLPVERVFFDGGQFAQIPLPLRRIMTPVLHMAMKSLYRSKGKTLKRILWCDDDAIKPYFIEAGRHLTYGNLHRLMTDSLENKPFPPLPKTLQEHTFWAFGSAEDHFKYRDAVMQAYPFGHFPVFENYNHMQFQIRNPEGFARMLQTVMKENRLPALPFLRS